jgi:hypothetical protein
MTYSKSRKKITWTVVPTETYFMMNKDLQQFLKTKPALQKIFKRILHTKEKVNTTMKTWQRIS